MIQVEARSSTHRFLDRYEASIPGRSAQFIHVVRSSVLLELVLGKSTASAIGWGEEAERLKHDSLLSILCTLRDTI